MKSKDEYWERLLKGYERSGLSQEAFCSAQGIPIEKFNYQWRKQFGTRSNKTKAQNNSDTSCPFEPILISNQDTIQQEPVTSQSIIIRFPNQICCEIKIDIKSKDFSSLLNQLRLLC
jgi:hypothetical protein